MEASATWRGGFETRLRDDRGHEVTVDLPPDEGGADAGTSSLELTVLSLAGCISTIFALVARKRRLTYEAFTVRLIAERPDGAPTITAVTGSAAIVSSAPPEDVETALRLTLRTCPVGVMLDRARIPVHVACEVTPPTSPSVRTPGVEA